MIVESSSYHICSKYFSIFCFIMQYCYFNNNFMIIYYFFLPFCSIKCNLKSTLIKFMIINMTFNHNNSSNIEIR